MGLALQKHVSVATAAFVVLALATVSFDGFQDTETWVNMRTDMLSFATSDVVDTVALALAPGAVWHRLSGVRVGDKDTVPRRSRP